MSLFRLRDRAVGPNMDVKELVLMVERIMPSKAELEKMLGKGMSLKDIADEVERLTGRRVAVSTVGSVLSREGLTTPKARYAEEIPWRVKSAHLQAYPARMLRLLARRRRGVSLTEQQGQNLDSWLHYLETEKAVVGYDPDSPEGFYYVDRKGSEGRNGIPIRKQRIDVAAMRG